MKCIIQELLSLWLSFVQSQNRWVISMVEVVCFAMCLWRDCERGNFRLRSLFGLYSPYQVEKSLHYFDAAIMKNSEVVIRTGVPNLKLFLVEEPCSSSSCYPRLKYCLLKLSCVFCQVLEEIGMISKTWQTDHEFIPFKQVEKCHFHKKVRIAVSFVHN